MRKISKEELLISPLPARFIDPGKGLKIVLTREEVKEIVERTGSVTVILLFDASEESRQDSHRAESRAYVENGWSGRL